MINLSLIAKTAVGLVEKLVPFGSVAGPLIEEAQAIFHHVSEGLSAPDVADLTQRLNAADAERMRTWKEADDALDRASRR